MDFQEDNKCYSSNLAETVLDLFLDAVNRDGERWPLIIGVDRGFENVLSCNAMVQFRGERRASFIAATSTHNQRIEHLWREVYLCIYKSPVFQWNHQDFLMWRIPLSFSLCILFLSQNQQFPELSEAFNTEGNWPPYQMWMNGMIHANNPLA